MPSESSKPWYREPWPWLLMAGPAAVVVAGAVTIGLAVQTFDGLVAEDYYKQGLTVNQRLARERAAETLGIGASLEIDAPAGGAVRVHLIGPAALLPKSLALTLSHPTRAGLDQQVTLLAAGDGRYVGRIESLAAGRWHLIVEDDGGQWRIRGGLQSPLQRSAVLAGGR